MAETSYPALDLAQGLFKRLVWDPMIVSATAALFAAAPWLATWPLGPIVRSLILRFTDKLYALLDKVVDLQVIVLVNAAHRAEYERASVKLKLLAKDKGIDSPEFKEARDAAKVSLAKFVSYSG